MKPLIYDIGDTVYTITERPKNNFILMECVVEEILGSDNYGVYDVTNNRMLVRNVRDLISLNNMEYSTSEWMKIKINKN